MATCVPDAVPVTQSLDLRHESDDMQFPESWLREFCNPPLNTRLADLLTMSGMEVEELQPVAPPFAGVVVGEVLEVERAPERRPAAASARVDAGAGATLDIVCGAPNVRAGIKVPLRPGRR